MPAYTIRRELPPVPERVSTAPTVSSVYSDENGAGAHPADVRPLTKAQTSQHPSYHAHPRQQINDYGPQVRQSRLPIFKQVRSMLHKPPPITTPGNPKWDDYTGELSDSGKPSSVKPSAYVSPYEGAFQANRARSPVRPSKSRKSSNSRKSLSPVSVLRDSEVYHDEPPQASRASPHDLSPVSPVSPFEDHYQIEGDLAMIPKALMPNVQRTQPQQTPSSNQIKRKPAPRSTSTTENQPPPASPPRSPGQASDVDDGMIDHKDADRERQPTSHFSWTTYAPSVAPGRQSIDTMATRNAKPSPSLPQADFEPPNSRFSWSTVATNTTHQARPESPPPSPPPPIPAKYSAPPVQSILSRQRPIRRVEKEEWTPPPRDSSRGTPRSATPQESSTPTSAHTARPLPLPKDWTPTGHSPASTKSSGKALPPPPSLHASNNLTHLESLLAQASSIMLQRRNVERGIAELEKVEKASPLDVPFNTVRDAKKRLAELRNRLAEVKLEERDVGIAVTRARLKEEKETGGDGESLWVRRVTG